MFCGIASAAIPRWRPVVGPMIETALQYGDGGFTADDVLDRCEKKLAGLWAGFSQECATSDPPECVLVTEIVAKPRRTIARLWIAAGRNLGLWLPIGQPVLDRWALAEGATALELRGRPGWTRRAPGWRLDEVVMRRDLA